MAEAACVAHGNGVYLAVPSQKGGSLMKSLQHLLSNAVLIAFIVFSSTLYGQTAAGDPTPVQAADSSQNVPSVKVTTRLVIVDVVAHDKKGHAITDLEATDLRILEDGKEHPI